MHEAIEAAAKAIEAVHGDYKPTAEDYRTMARAALAAALPPLRAREEIARVIREALTSAYEEREEPTDADHLKAADAVLALSSPAGQEWRDISSAPAWDNRKQVYVWGGRYSAPTLVEADGDYWRANRSRLTMLPTHWFPSYPPAPPAAEPIVAEKSEVKS